MHHLDDDAIYFKCPNCPATYNFKEFQKLEHKSPASPIDGPDRLGLQNRNALIFGGPTLILTLKGSG